MTDIEDLAKRISDLSGRLDDLTRTSQIANTSLTQGGETTDLSDTVLAAQDAAGTIPGLQELLDANEEAIAANNVAVGEAITAATQASADGIAAGELASAAADVANDNATAANTAAADAKSRADAAASAAAAAGISAGNAQTSANGALTAAQTAGTAASAAQSTADAAKADAGAAKTAADNANTAALNAAGIANGKGKVIYSTTAPTGTDQNVNNLWVDTSGTPAKNTPNRWNGSAWVAITDKAATDAATAATNAQTTATNAATAAANAQTTANTANTAAGTAQSAATAANNAAQAADTKAVNAATAAANAQTTANSASTDAATAAGIANGKGKVIYSTTAPTGTDQNANNLWINTSGSPALNTPNRWSGSAWVAVTDKAATDAAALAATANTAATNANTAATNAATAATNAQTTANGKNQVTYSTATPSNTTNPGTRAGDIWFVRNASGWLSAQYEWSGSAWIVRSLDSAIIAYLDAGKITAGTLDANRIGANSITATHLAADSVTSNAILAGTIQAVDIASGTITGDRIAAATLSASLLIADTITSREIGADAVLARNIKALQVTATHIAASTITGDKIAANTVTAANIAAGTITANEIAAGTITATQINLDTLNGKTINGVSINGSTLSTATTGTRVVIGTAPYSSGDPTLVGQIQFLDSSYSASNAAGAYMRMADPHSIGIGPLGEVPRTVIGLPRRKGMGGANAQSTVDVSTRIIEADSQISTPQIIDYLTGKVLVDDSGWKPLGIPGGFTADATLGATGRRTGQIVKLRGQVNVNTGSLGTNTTFATLGATQFGPSQPLYFICPTGATSWARIRIMPDGGISAQGLSGTATYVHLDSITFMVDVLAPVGGGAPQ